MSDRHAITPGGSDQTRIISNRSIEERVFNESCQKQQQQQQQHQERWSEKHGVNSSLNNNNGISIIHNENKISNINDEDSFYSQHHSPSLSRPSKSYLERYKDIRKISLDRDHSRKESHQRSRSFDRWNSQRDATDQKIVSTDRVHIYDTDSISIDEDSAVALKRWENRKERKAVNAEDRSQSFQSNSPSILSKKTSVKISRWSPRIMNSDDCNETLRSKSFDHDEYYQKSNSVRDLLSRPGPIEYGDTSSPLFTNSDEEDLGKIGVGYQSPLSINYHFDEEKERISSKPWDSLPQQLTSRQQPEQSIPQSMHTERNYDENIQFFSDGANAFVHEAFPQRPELKTSTRGAKKPEKVNYHPPDPLPSSSSRECNIKDPEAVNYLYNEEEEDEIDSFRGKRIRWAASDCCRRFTSNREKSSQSMHNGAIFRKAQEICLFQPSVLKSLDERNKIVLYFALIICVACIFAASFTVKHFSTERGASYTYGVAGFTSNPASSLMSSESPSFTPSLQPSSLPTFRPSNERQESISAYLEIITDGESNIEGTPQFLAKMWILYQDELNLDIPTYGSVELKKAATYRVEQRFALAVVYFALGIGPGGVLKGWLEGDECKYLGDYDTTWDGVNCGETGEVRTLALDGANLTGIIPREISLLHHMENLIIKHNPKLRGKIPESLDQMYKLRQLGLYGNQLTGTIPKAVFLLPELEYLNLADNVLMGELDWEGLSHQKKLSRLILQNNFLEGSIHFHLLAESRISLLGLSNNLFSGAIDSSVGSVVDLEYLYLDRNKLAGRIPNTLGNLTKLLSLNFDENRFDGTIPSTIGHLDNLKYLSARGNKLYGGVPSSFRLLTSLKTLNLANNALSGDINFLEDMLSLENVHLYQNGFTGEIPVKMFTLSNLKTLFLSSNSISGKMPDEVANGCNSLEGLYVSDNNFHGNIPDAICSLQKLEDLFIDTNSFTGQLPSCLGKMINLKRFFAFKNKLIGDVPTGLFNLPNLVDLGLEGNNISGGMSQTCANNEEKINIWADCYRLIEGCGCCTKCCTNEDSQCT